MVAFHVDMWHRRLAGGEWFTLGASKGLFAPFLWAVPWRARFKSVTDLSRWLYETNSEYPKTMPSPMWHRRLGGGNTGETPVPQF